MIKTFLFFLSILIYILLGLSARMQRPLLELDSFEDANKKYLMIIVLLTIMTSAGYLFVYRKLFPKDSAAQGMLGRTGIFTGFLCLTFLINREWMLTLNNWFPRNAYVQQLTVERRWKEKKRKRTVYKMVVTDSVGPHYYLFRINQGIYNAYDKGDGIKLKIFDGAFGIKHAEEVL